MSAGPVPVREPGVALGACSLSGRGWQLCWRSSYGYEVGGPVGCEVGGPVGWEVGGPVGCEAGGPVGCEAGGPAGWELWEDDARGCGTAAQ
jgi:hypothetical protein